MPLCLYNLLVLYHSDFGGVNPICINEYYLNRIYTTGYGAVGIPIVVLKVVLLVCVTSQI
jgi:hypothetical protein